MPLSLVLLLVTTTILDKKKVLEKEDDIANGDCAAIRVFSSRCLKKLFLENAGSMSVKSVFDWNNGLVVDLEGDSARESISTCCCIMGFPNDIVGERLKNRSSVAEK